MMFSTLLDGSCALGALSMESLKSFKNYPKEELYIQLISATSIIVKYKADPRIATGLYYSLFSLISTVFMSESANFTATSLA
jgi:hypothetical protein